MTQALNQLYDMRPIARLYQEKPTCEAEITGEFAEEKKKALQFLLGSYL